MGAGAARRGRTMETVLLIDRRDGWVKLTLNRATRLNAFNDELHRALAAALDEAAADDACRAVLLTGAGRGFCAGQDLAAVPAGGDLGETVEQFYNPLIRRLRALRKPVVCAVNGVAAGAGSRRSIGNLKPLQTTRKSAGSRPCSSSHSRCRRS